MGRLFDERPLRFVYDKAWMSASDAYPISPAMPLTQHDHAGEVVHAFFENLLPEGEKPAPPHYRATTWRAVAALVAENADGARISSAGAQDKCEV